MPIPAVVAAGLISGGAQLAGGVTNALSAGAMNKKQRKFIRERYGVERADSLSDWAMQNEYNSPRQQMQRLQEADLNPHLVYGGGSGVTTAGAVKATDSKSYSPMAPRPGDAIAGAGNAVMGIYDLKIKKAQADNLTASNTNILMDTLLKRAELLTRTTGNESKIIDLENKKELNQAAKELYNRNPLVEQWLNVHDKNVAGINLSYAQEEELRQRIKQNADKHPGNLAIQIETVKNFLVQRAKTDAERRAIEASIQNLLREGKLKDLDINLKDKGVQPGDPAWMRIIIQSLNL